MVFSRFQRTPGGYYSLEKTCSSTLVDASKFLKVHAEEHGRLSAS